MFCKKCGKELPEGSTFCDACGTKVEEEKVVVVQNVPVQPVKVKTGLGCAITALVLAIFACIFLLIPVIGLILYVIFAYVSLCFVLPALIISLIKIIKKKCLGKAITSMVLAVVACVLDLILVIAMAASTAA